MKPERSVELSEAATVHVYEDQVIIRHDHDTIYLDKEEVRRLAIQLEWFLDWNGPLGQLWHAIDNLQSYGCNLHCSEPCECCTVLRSTRKAMQRLVREHAPRPAKRRSDPCASDK